MIGKHIRKLHRALLPHLKRVVRSKVVSNIDSTFRDVYDPLVYVFNASMSTYFVFRNPKTYHPKDIKLGDVYSFELNEIRQIRESITEWPSFQQAFSLGMLRIVTRKESKDPKRLIEAAWKNLTARSDEQAKHWAKRDAATSYFEDTEDDDFILLGSPEDMEVVLARVRKARRSKEIIETNVRRLAQFKWTTGKPDYD